MDAERGVRIVRGLSALSLGPAWGLTYMLSAHRWVRRLAAEWDLIHNHQVSLHSWISLRAARALGRPCLLRFACSGPGGDLAVLRQQRFGRWQVSALRAATRLVALTPGAAEEIQSFGLPSDRIRIIPNGVDVESFTVQPWPAPAAREPLRLLFVGRLHAQKGMDVLLEALRRTQRPADFSLRVVGAGPELERLRTQAAQAGLASVVQFWGQQNDLLAHYAWCEVVVLPSRFEGMPNAVLEAMSCARPTLGTAIDGTADLLADGAAGWLAEKDNAAALAVHLERLLNDRQRLPSYGHAGRLLAERRYSIEHVASTYIREYEAMLADRAPRPS
jgi:glycosyltransferase involved in cell wall biosynthesis